MSSFAGIGLKLLATFLLSIMIAIVKYASTTVPTGEIMFARSFFALIPLVIMAMMQGKLRDCVATHRPWKHATRAVVGVAAMTCWFTALSIIPLPEATAISFCAPLLIVVLSAIFLKERVRFYRWTAVFIGFVGVSIILWPRLSASSDELASVGVMLALAAVICMAIAAILVRGMTATETNASIVFYFTATAALFSLFSLYWGWVLPDLKVFSLLVIAGLLGGLGQIAMTQAFRCAEASLLAPFDYSNMVWAVLLGIFVFDEYPSFPVLLGGTIVVMAGLFIIYRENKLGVTTAQYRPVKTL
ncbi:MAG: DMT family transporter [Rhizobiaceae bacterium]|nr:DMT family transporter [Rhizobiaceae bacterium]